MRGPVAVICAALLVVIAQLWPMTHAIACPPPPAPGFGGEGGKPDIGPPPTIAAGPVVNPSNGHTYYIFVLESSWSAGEAQATSFGGHLATINDATENGWVTTTFFAQGSWYVGLSDASLEGSFLWSNGEALAYTNWVPYPPLNLDGSEDYALMSAADGTWSAASGVGATYGGDEFDSHPHTDPILVLAEFTSPPVFLPPGTPDPTLIGFASAVSQPLEGSPRRITAANVNDLVLVSTSPDIYDTYLDLVMTDPGRNQIVVYPGVGNGTLGTPIVTELPAGDAPFMHIVTDVNGDGHKDVVFTDTAQNHIGVALGAGDGTFGTPTTIATGNGPFDICEGEFAGDSNFDLAVSCSSDNTVQIMAGDGAGNFTLVATIPLGGLPESTAGKLVAAKLDDDLLLDLAVCRRDSTDGSLGALVVLKQNSAGIFTVAATLDPGADPTNLVAGDFDGNAKVDLASTQSSASTLQVWLNTTDAFGMSFGPPSTTDLGGHNPSCLGFARFEPGVATLLVGESCGHFDRFDYVGGAFIEIDHAEMGGSIALTIADFNGDGDLDFAVASQWGKLSLLVHAYSAPTAVSTIPLSVTPHTGAAAGPVTLTFPTVATAGETTVVTNSVGPNPPENFTLGAESAYFYVETTATFTGNVTIRFTYDPTGMTGAQEGQLVLMHWNGTVWEVPVTGTAFLDTGLNIIGGDFSSLSPFAIMRPANAAPVANAGTDATVQATGAATSVTLNGAASGDADGDALTYAWSGNFVTKTGVSPTVTLPLGAHTITLTVTDTHGASAVDTVVITVVDTTAPAITSLSATPATLTTPNHKMVAVTLTGTATDAVDAAPALHILSVTSNEATTGCDDDDVAVDWAVTGAMTLNLRAERSGKGSGRIYTITVQATDASGNSSVKTVTVTVPKGSDKDDDKGGKKDEKDGKDKKDEKGKEKGGKK